MHNNVVYSIVVDNVVNHSCKTYKQAINYLKKEYQDILESFNHWDIINENVNESGVKNTACWEIGFLGDDFVTITRTFIENDVDDDIRDVYKYTITQLEHSQGYKLIGKDIYYQYLSDKNEIIFYWNGIPHTVTFDDYTGCAIDKFKSLCTLVNIQLRQKQVNFIKGLADGELKVSVDYTRSLNIESPYGNVKFNGVSSDGNLIYREKGGFGIDDIFTSLDEFIWKKVY